MKIRYMLLHAYGMGGTIRTVITQANAMAERGHEVEIVSTVRRRDDTQFQIDPRVKMSAIVDQRGGIEPVTFTDRVMRRLRGKAVPEGEFAAHWFTAHVEKAVTEYVAGLDDGILVTTRPGLNLIAARHGRKSVVRVGQEHMNLRTHKEPVRQEIARQYGRLDLVTVLTRTDMHEYQRLAPGVKTRLMPNSVHIGGRRQSHLTNPRVIAAGRLKAQKGFDLLIPAFEQVPHPDWTLDVYGEGSSLPKLLSKISQAERIRFRGRTEKLWDELADSSIYVLSSRFEGLPMVMLEAMAHGLAVVSFDCPTGPGDVIVDNVNGLLVPPKDTVALGEAITRLIEDDTLRKRLGGAALETARNYTADSIMPRWEALFTELLARS